MKVLLSWIRDFVDVPGTAEAIGERMSLRGLPLEGLEPYGETDAVLDFEVTANRPDCLSIVGIAREIATAYRLPFKRLDKRSGAVRAPGSAGDLPVTIEEPELCRRYVAAVADVRVGPSPAWMQERLRAVDQRPINNVVDITNYVLLELGHPMHAFDLARLRGAAIVVRRARPGETLVTLDGKARTLDTDVLVIADAEQASAIGGVMGGAESEVSQTTTEIVLESAWFKPQSVRATSRRLGLRTEASYRFERGADLTAPAVAMERALALLEASGAGRRKGGAVDSYPLPHKDRHLLVEADGIKQLLGMHVPDDEIERILTSLDFETTPLGSWQASAPEAAAPMHGSGRGWRVKVPARRVDVTRTVDLIEEVGRHYGYEHLPTTFPAAERAPGASDPRLARDRRVRSALLGMGFNEAITFGFIEAAAGEPYLGDGDAVALANPLSEKFTTLRPSLIPGLVDVVSHNRRHGRRDVRVFEIGTRFSTRGEVRAAAAAWTGAAQPPHWSGGARDVDFFDLKGVAERLCELAGVEPQFAPSRSGFLVAGRAADVAGPARPIGVIGQLQPAIAERRDLPGADPVYVLEFDLDSLTEQTPRGPRLAASLPRHPSVVRDVSILVDDTLSAESVRGTIRSAAPAILVDVREFDRYQGKGIPDGKVSLSFRLTFQAADRTLTDSEVHTAMERIVGTLTRELGAIQR